MKRYILILGKCSHQDNDRIRPHTRRLVVPEDINKGQNEVEEYERIFERYLDVCNQAIEKNKDRFPYPEIWKARWNKCGSNNILQCAIYDDRPKVVYTMQLTQDMKIKIIKKTEVSAEDAWPFKISYLKKVVENPNEYIDHPANLDWGWLNVVFG